jgi:hypothetical protein
MSKFDEAALAEATGKAAMKTASAKDEPVETQRQTIVYDIPKAWLKAVKEKRHSTISGYMRAALQEKLERDGAI